MKYFKLSPFLILSFIFITSCNSLKVTTDYDHSIDFSNYKTFSFYNLKTTGSVSQLNADRIVASIRSEMVHKGYVETSNEPSLMINALTILKDKQAVSATTNYYGYGGIYRPYYYYGGLGMGIGTTTISTYNYKDGSLSIDIVDTKTQKLVWQGNGNKEIDKSLNNPGELITSAVKKIMTSFPNNINK